MLNRFPAPTMALPIVAVLDRSLGIAVGLGGQSLDGLGEAALAPRRQSTQEDAGALISGGLFSAQSSGESFGSVDCLAL